MINSKFLSKRNEGFTLIEVVIVLAIAALIIFVVLQAVNGANKTNRDNARKNEAGRMVSYLEQYASNNTGVYPDTAAAAQTAVIAVDATLGNTYTFTAGTYSATGPITGACAISPVTASSKEVLYAPDTLAAGKHRNYELGVCLEGSSTVVSMKQ